MNCFQGCQGAELGRVFCEICTDRNYEVYLNQSTPLMPMNLRATNDDSELEPGEYKISKSYGFQQENVGFYNQFQPGNWNSNIDCTPAYMPPYEMSENQTMPRIWNLRPCLADNIAYLRSPIKEGLNTASNSDQIESETKEELRVEEGKQLTVRDIYESIIPQCTIICHCCGEEGHTSFQCKEDPISQNELIEILESNKEYNKIAKSVICYKCCQQGHFPIQCNKLRREAEMQKLMKFEVDCKNNVNDKKFPKFYSHKKRRNEIIPNNHKEDLIQQEDLIQISSSWDKIFNSVISYYASNISEFMEIDRMEKS